MRYINDEINDLAKNLIQIERATDGLADLMQDAQLLPRQIEGLLNSFYGIVGAAHCVQDRPHELACSLEARANAA